MANYLNFGEIIAEVERVVKQYQSSMQGLVKSVINQVYLNEIMQCDNLYPLHWMHSPVKKKLHAAKTITAASVAAQVVITSASHGFASGEIISIWDVVGMTQLNFDRVAPDSYLRLFVVDDTDLAANTFKLNDLGGTAVDSSAFTAYTSGGTILHHGWSMGSLIKEIKSVSIYDGSPLDPMSWKELIEDTDSFISDSSATPYRYLHQQTFSAAGAEQNLLMTFPGSQENKIAYAMLTANAARLSASTDVPLLPPQFHDSIISGAVTRLLENNVQVENAVIWPGLYKSHIEAIKTFNRKWWKQHESEQLGAPYLL